MNANSPVVMNTYEGDGGRLVVFQSDKTVVETPNGTFRRVPNDARRKSVSSDTIVSAASERSVGSDGKPQPAIIVPPGVKVEESVKPVAANLAKVVAADKAVAQGAGMSAAVLTHNDPVTPVATKVVPAVVK